MDKPEIVVFEEPHNMVAVTFPNGTRVMVCDASTDDELVENVVVTGITSSTERILYRAVTLLPGQALDLEAGEHPG